MFADSHWRCLCPGTRRGHVTLISRMQGCVYMTGAERNMCATQVIAGHLQVMPTAVVKGQAWQP